MATQALKCERHGEFTRLTCVDCGKPICPKCAVRTEVGLKCEDDATPAAIPEKALAMMRPSRTPLYLALAGAVVLAVLIVVLLSLRGGDSGEQTQAQLPPTGSWTQAPDLATIRGTTVSVTLKDGKVLVAGGGVGAIPVAAAELFDPADGQWKPTGQLNEARRGHAVALLNDGRVLIAGGRNPDGDPTASAEMYDPAAGTWTTTAPMSLGRIGHTMTTLADGRVLAAGGTARGTGVAGGGQTIAPVATAEIFDPRTGSWRSITNMSTARFEHTATALADGKVLMAGGQGPGDGGRVTALATAELYDPAADSFVATTNLSEGRTNHAAVLLADRSTVLVVGGAGGTNADVSLGSAELYDARSGSWTRATPLSEARTGATATLLADGRVLVAGGESATRGQRRSLKKGEVFDPQAREWRSAGDMQCPRSEQAATLLGDGTVLVVAGDAAFPGQAPIAQGCVDRYKP
ncbi:MAG TPA: kelch repeat-containing protein [Acidimicrobiales bacterium]|nr:kelch repeat-containing protein [Acidimicrobiales bacterium]